MTTTATEPRTDAEAGILSYLTAMTEMRKRMPGAAEHPYPYFGADDFILTHGTFATSTPLTAEERAYLKAVLKTYGNPLPPKQCFYNSQLVLLTATTWMPENPAMVLRYVEGYVQGNVMPIHHGWLTLNGKVIDTTLRMGVQPATRPLANRTKGTFPDAVAYFGVPFRTEEVRASVVERGEGATLLIDFKRKFPFLRVPYTVTP